MSALKASLKETVERQHGVMLAMRETALAIGEAEKNKQPTGELDEKLKKQQADFDALDARARTLDTAIKSEEKLSVVTNDMERQRAADDGERNTPPQPGERKTSPKAREAFSAFIRGKTREMNEALASLGPSERHALLGSTNSLGGFLVPEDFKQEVIKILGGVTVMRAAGARVVPTSSPVLHYPAIVAGTDPYMSGFEGAWRAQGELGTDGTAPPTQDQPKFERISIPVHLWQPAAVVITRELLDDSAAPLESILAEVIAQTKAQDEDAAFIKGTGVGGPRGISDYVGASTGPSIPSVVSGDASLFTYNGLLDLVHTLPMQYRSNQRAVMFMRSLVLSSILKLKDSSNMPILYNGLPGTLLGYKFWLTEHMPALAGNAYPLILGDPSYYCIAERSDMQLQRLEERFAPNVAFLPSARLGGGLLVGKAFIAQKIST